MPITRLLITFFRGLHRFAALKHLNPYKMRAKLLTWLLFVGVTFTTTVAQQSTVDGEKDVLPDAIMEQVVSRIVRWQFKPRRNKKTIPIAAVGIKREWLPKITNISFELVPENEALKYENGVFLFDKVDKAGRSYTIDVGWGDFDCIGSGDTWKFNIVSQRVRLWRTGGRWGRGCGNSGNSPTTIRGLKLTDTSPNELPGYEFFAKGKLKDIRLGISTRDDIKKLFGDTCEGVCDYDDKWNIWVNYFGVASKGTQTSYSNGKETKTFFEPKPERIGTLYFVRLTPKKPISFSTIVFPRTFVSGISNVIGDSFSNSGEFQGAVHSEINIYTDGYGLQYDVFNRITFNNLPSTERSRRETGTGELTGIEYNIPDSLNSEIYNVRPEN